MSKASDDMLSKILAVLERIAVALEAIAEGEFDLDLEYFRDGK